MEIDAPGSDPLPVRTEPENRTAYVLEQNIALKKAIVRFMKRDGLNNVTFGRLEIDHANANKLSLIVDSAGNHHLHLE